MRRRRLLQATASLSVGQQVLARALQLPAVRGTGSLADVAHIVVLTQENRSFDHYFGSLPGVRGFGDRFPVPVAGGRTVWQQPREDGRGWLQPFALDLQQHPQLMRIQGTPHTWPDAQAAWDLGRMGGWTRAKQDHSMAHYRPSDLPFQVALADAFTLCDAYHCSFPGGTTPNRLFLFTGTHDGQARGHGPALNNDYEDFDADPAGHGGYTWTTCAERLQAAGVSWQVYQDLADNFTDNPLSAFRRFRDAFHARPGHDSALRERACRTRTLADLHDDVQRGRLPQVCWVVGTAAGSEHPGPSSPAQGAAYVAEVLDALTANPAVWARTVLLVNFDENDGFFDHVPPPAPPAPGAGHSGVALDGEIHRHLPPNLRSAEHQALLGRPYGLGPRVPMWVVSPWSRGGWVNSQVFDHTSVLRLIEARFGVPIPEISPWRRAVCGDLKTCFDFTQADVSLPSARLPPRPESIARAQAAARIGKPQLPPLPMPGQRPAPSGLYQAPGQRPARPLPYEVAADIEWAGSAPRLALRNTGAAGLVLQAWNGTDLRAVPWRWTLAAGQAHRPVWPAGEAGAVDCWLLGPNGFHRHFSGHPGAGVELQARHRAAAGALELRLRNAGPSASRVEVTDGAYGTLPQPLSINLAPGASRTLRLSLAASDHWYDLELQTAHAPSRRWRLAGHVETGRPSRSDPAMHTVGPEARP